MAEFLHDFVERNVHADICFELLPEYSSDDVQSAVERLLHEAEQYGNLILLA